MPIRMVDDPQDPEEQNSNDGGGDRGGGGFPGGGGGGGGLLGLLPLLFSLFRGKGIIFLLVIGAIAYFVMGRGGCNFGSVVNQAGNLATGGFLDPRQFQKAEVYEALADDNNKNPLPESANLQRFAPAVGDQGQQGSCVAWSSAYAARSILEAARTGQPGESVKFSPAFLYNQIGLDGCQGSYIVRAMEFMTQRGAVPYETFPYSDQDCSRQPNQSQLQEAAQYKMRGFNRLSDGDRTDKIDLRAIRENLAQGAPVAIGMMVGQSFMQNMMGQDVWNPEQDDRSMMGFGGHAMCVVGYDDKKYGGSFLLMNSWGPKWGNNGFAWVRYNDFKYYVREAYGLDPMQRVGAAANQPFTCDIGLVEVAINGNKTVAKGYIPLRLAGSNRFQTTAALQKAVTRFKMEVRNSTECYVYVFGKETDGTSFTLFPYPRTDDPTKTRYSPFCGITGARLFPKDKSMRPDSLGKRDEIAIVISKKELDWNAINKAISANPSTEYATRVNNALGSSLLRNVSFQASSKGTISFTTPASDAQVAACVVEIDKQ